MTIDERKMTIAYADMLAIGELVQHIMRMDADDMFDENTRHEFAVASTSLDKVKSSVGKWMSEHTNFNGKDGK